MPIRGKTQGGNRAGFKAHVTQAGHKANALDAYCASDLNVMNQNKEQYMINNFKIVWIGRIFFPCLFFVLIAWNIIYLIQKPNLITDASLLDWFIFFLSIFVAYSMLFTFTAKYEVSDAEIIVQSFFKRRKVYKISEIQHIEDKPSIGIDWAIFHFKDDKKLNIFGLSDHTKFMQLINSKLYFNDKTEKSL